MTAVTPKLASTWVPPPWSTAPLMASVVNARGTNPVGGLILAAVVVAGIVALLTGRPDGLPPVSSAPASRVC